MKVFKYIFPSFFFFLMVSNLVAQTLSNIDARQYLDTARVRHIEAKYEEAISWGEKALIIYKKNVGEMDTLTANAYEVIGKSQVLYGKYDEALANFEKNYTIRKAAYQNNHPALAEVLHQIGVVYYYMAKYDTALDYFKQGLDIRLTLFGSEHPLVVKSKFTIGSVAYQKGDFDTALEYFKSVLEIRLKILDPIHPDIASSYMSMAGICIEQDNYDQAINYFEKALAINLELFAPDHPNIGTVYGNLGVAYSSKGHYDTALEYYFKALKIDEKSLGKEHPNLASNHHRIGNIYVEKKDFKNALFHYKLAEKIWTTVYGADNINTTWAYLGLGSTYLHIAEHNKALRYLEKSLKILLVEYSEPNTTIASAYINIGLVYQNLEQHENAIQNLQYALALLEQIYGKEHSRVALTLTNMGNSYSKIGEYDKALKMFQRALYLRKKIYGDDHHYIASSYQNMGLTYNRIGLKEKAIEYYQKALAINLDNFEKTHGFNSISHRSIGYIHLNNKNLDSAFVHFQQALNIDTLVWDQDHINLGFSYRALGRVLQEKEKYKEAFSYLEKSLSVFRKTGGEQSLNVADSHYSLGEHFFIQGNYKKAKHYFQHACRLKKSLLGNGHPEMAEYYFALGDVFQKEKLFDLGRLYFDSTLVCLNNFRKTYATPLSRKTYLGKTKYLFEQIIRSYTKDSKSKNYFPDKAFEYSERAKSNSLLDAIYAAKTRQFSRIPDDLLTQEDSLKIALAYYDKKRNTLLESGLSETDTSVLAIAITQSAIIHQFEKLVSKLKIDFPNYYKVNYDTTTIDLYVAQNELLIDKQNLLSYFVGDTSIFIYLLQQNNYEVHEIKRDFPLDDWVQEMTKEGISGYYSMPQNKRNPGLEESTISNYTNAAQKLYNKLIAPVADKLSKDLIIIPDGILGYLPFEALLTSAPLKEGAFKTYPFLLKKHQISYCYSATLLREMQQKQHHKKATNQLLAMAPFFQGDVHEMVERIDTSELLALRDSLVALPASGEEVAAIVKILDGTPSYGTGATLQQFEQLAADYRILHLSTHGKADDRVGDYAYLAFGVTDETGTFDRLYARDLYNYTLNADMVVLSACETGIGKLQRGEGIISLARAFAYAGAKSIFTTLWQVSDEKTKYLMVYFYKNLKQGQTKDAALRNAKLEYMDKNNSEALHPFFWAGLIGIGDMSRLSAKE